MFSCAGNQSWRKVGGGNYRGGRPFQRCLLEDSRSLIDVRKGYSHTERSGGVQIQGSRRDNRRRGISGLGTQLHVIFSLLL